MSKPVPRVTPRHEAITILARQAGIPPGDPYGPAVAATLARLPRLVNRQIEPRDAGAVTGAETVQIMAARERRIDPPLFINGHPAWFPEQPRLQENPAVRLLGLEGGCLARIAGAPVVLSHDGTSFVRDFSSRYAGLVHGYDIDLRPMLADARRIEGAAIVLCDDVSPPSYGHWLLRQVPRLAGLGAPPDATVIASDERRDDSRDSLRLCGFPDARIVRMGDFQLVRADLLVVPGDLAEMPHPGDAVAPWMLDFIRARLGFAALARHASSAMPRKLYVSRNDSPGRLG